MSAFPVPDAGIDLILPFAGFLMESDDAWATQVEPRAQATDDTIGASRRTVGPASTVYVPTADVTGVAETATAPARRSPSRTTGPASGPATPMRCGRPVLRQRQCSLWLALTTMARAATALRVQERWACPRANLLSLVG